MRLRSLLPLLAVAGFSVGCTENPTLAGVNPPGLNVGSLVVARTEFFLGNQLGGPRQIVVDPSSGASLTPATWLPVGYPDQGVHDLNFSRDGKWMAWIQTRGDPSAPCYQFVDYCQSLDRPTQELFVSRVGSGRATLLTPQYNYDGPATFSPDGSRLVFLRTYYDGDQQMITVGRDGENLEPVLQKTPRRRSTPEWSPDGKSILYLQPDAEALYVVTPDGKTNSALTANRSIGGPASWAPTGERIAVIARDRISGFGPDDIALLVLDRTGQEITRAPFGWQGRSQRPVWSPDGTRIAYCQSEVVEDKYVRSVVRILDIATGASTTITPQNFSDCNPIWRP
ncbi:MAG: hypothetical protein V4558_08000 [Gemmatimonadota bacterium]